MELVIILILILLNGIFAMSEMSLVSARKFRLENEKNRGSSGAKKALELSENPTKFLSTVQIGITLIGILLGVYSGENLTDNVEAAIQRISFLAPYSQQISTGIVVVMITYFSIVLGELLPKRLGMTFPEQIISVLAKPMHFLSLITAPFVWLLTSTNNFLLKILGIKGTKDSVVSEEEIKNLIKESADGGDIQEIEQSIVERVFELGDRKVKSLLTHRTDIVYFDVADSWTEIYGKINGEKHSAYPVVENENLDEIIGIVLLKDLFSVVDRETRQVKDFVRKPLFINENSYAYKVLEMFKAAKVHYAFVLDEYGSTIGMITMDDILDALVGDSTDIDQEEYAIVSRDENSWLMDGQYSLHDFGKYFQLHIEDELIDKYSTVAGLILHELETIPGVGEKIEYQGLTLEIVDKDGQRIDKILVVKD